MTETTTFDLSPLEPLLDKYTDRKRDALLPFLHEAQKLYGWLPEEIQRTIASVLQVPLSEIHGVIEFYTMFYNEPTAKRVIRVCEDPACSLAGGDAVVEAFEQKLGIKHGESTTDGTVTFETVPCLGMCDLAPSLMDGEKQIGKVRPAGVESILSGTVSSYQSDIYGTNRLLTKRIGVVNPGSLEDYRSHGGYQTLRKVLGLAPDQLISEIERSGILGRGGAMFPLGRKWRLTRAVERPASEKHIVVNADESEPGTFKDRVLMEGDPFAVIEAATIAAYAVGAENGWIFVRGEYPVSYEKLSRAVEFARNEGLLGKNILGKRGFDFDIEMRQGAGAYICGEETALFEAIEGKRGFPRIKPPFPVTSGLFDMPTAVNNVETLVAALTALDIGVDRWLSLGSEESTGTKLFCLSGHLQKPGLYEVPFGLTIRDLIEMAGGTPEDKSIKAILVGGAAGVIITPEQLDFELTYEESRKLQIPIGSGVIMVFDEDTDLMDVLYKTGRFFAHESCGKCFPCQLGTQRQMEILSRLRNRNGSDAGLVSGARQELIDVGAAMSRTSLCGLGQTAASVTLSTIDLWPEYFE